MIVFESVSKFFGTGEMSCKKLVGICADDASAVPVSRSGFLAQMEGKTRLLSDAPCRSPSSFGFENSDEGSTRSSEPPHQGS
jgi:hypothetical protein